MMEAIEDDLRHHVLAFLWSGETVWLTQKLIGAFFNKGRSTITEHLKTYLSLLKAAGNRPLGE